MAGVSIAELANGTYRVRWRERIGLDGNKTKWGSRSRTVSTRAAAIELQAKVLRALETTGQWVDPVSGTAKPVADPEEAAAAMLRECLANGDARSSVERWAYALDRWFRTARAQRGVGENTALDATIFTRDTITSAKEAWRAEGLADTTLHLTVSKVLDLWEWMADDPERWPGVPAPPRRRRGLRPKAPVYVAPPSPTAEEMDAVLRELAGDGRRSVSLRLCTVARFTGLRAAQILRLRRQDLDLDRRVLVVTTGKSRRERATQRVVPVSDHLLSELQPILGRPPDAPLICHPRTSVKRARVHIPTATVREAWERATARRQARREVWDPPSRGHARPIHAFRAGFQAALRTRGASEGTVRRLVGHRDTTAARHYVDDASVMDELRDAMALLPPIDWTPNTTS